MLALKGVSKNMSMYTKKNANKDQDTLIEQSNV